ncbi:sister chromatid cohesion protein PDS5 homolog A-B-like [Anneissia japonica]|uniref:sister chromatid cohesion protein PDS5 homolog A-B-like n=1 Tax=Anneissia japonica TaxID=1529436 RepID=UPI0014257A8E|nr:sister chromatid cohesion protein PDS5 homolog A-B-like [Anneissia japonica]XP_033110667.1 sister chromatid cohesion protein PDS5 homolog A-B-like [Anneissia japonica]XP_033110668.1 sister chromatid cohesion protein PDS5 homolog A-B-like [Anneissia japonica]
MTRTKGHRSSARIVYPSGVKELTPDLSKDELMRRLKALARAFQDMEQEEETDRYEPLAQHLVKDIFFKHQSKDIRLLVACCLADIFRIFAPEAPYKTMETLKAIFRFITKQLWGLENVESSSWKRYFYLLENLAMVKSYNICMELPDSNEIFVELFNVFFTIISENHSPKVRTFMLDIMCPLISENDAVTSELLERILVNLLDSKKIENSSAFTLAKDLIKRTASSIEPSIQVMFNSILILGKKDNTELGPYMYELIYQLNQVSSNILLSVLPQLELKLKSNDERERLSVTKLLGKMFSDKDSDLATQHKPLWNCFLGRFGDININVRLECVRFASQFILYHPYLVQDLTDKLSERVHDAEESVRQGVVSSIITAAKKDMTNVTPDLFNLVKERTLDKKWSIRKDAILGLSHVYKKWYYNPESTNTEKVKLAWIKDKILHMYYQTNMDDKLLVERIFTVSLVPFTLENEERMRRMFELYATVDQHSVRAVNELLKSQFMVRTHLQGLLELYEQEADEIRAKKMFTKLIVISKCLPDPAKAQEHLKRLREVLDTDLRIRKFLQTIVSPGVTCKKATFAVKEIMKKFGDPSSPNAMYETVQKLLERSAPLTIDSEAVKALIEYVAEEAFGQGVPISGEAEEGALVRGLQLLQTLSVIFPATFKTEETYNILIQLLDSVDDMVSNAALQVLINTGDNLESAFPKYAKKLIPVLQTRAREGTPAQAKKAILCLNKILADKIAAFKVLFEDIKDKVSLENEYILTTLTTLGLLSKCAPEHFSNAMKTVVAVSVVKGLLMLDNTEGTPSKGIWCQDDQVCLETQAKIHAIKLLVHWLEGLKSNAGGSGSSTIRLLATMIKNDGDLMERQKIQRTDMARLRLAAGCAMLKLAQEPCFSELITQEQFQLVALLINDECYHVRTRFAKKLNKHLISLRLPLSYMSIFSLCAKDPVKESRTQAKQFIVRNIQTRRECVRQHVRNNAQMMSLLPEYVVPYTIHLLAHDPDFLTLKDIEALRDIKECLLFMLEPLLVKSENFSFLKKLIETIKTMKDGQNPDEKSANRKLYAVCDLAHGLLMSKSASFDLKEYPTPTPLPSKLFAKPKKPLNNSESFLPKAMQHEFNPSDNKPKNSNDKLLETPPRKNTRAGKSKDVDEESTKETKSTGRKKSEKSDENTPSKINDKIQHEEEPPSNKRGPKRKGTVGASPDKRPLRESRSSQISSSPSSSPTKNNRKRAAENSPVKKAGTMNKRLKTDKVNGIVPKKGNARLKSANAKKLDNSKSVSSRRKKGSPSSSEDSQTDSSSVLQVDNRGMVIRDLSSPSSSSGSDIKRPRGRPLKSPSNSKSPSTSRGRGKLKAVPESQSIKRYFTKAAESPASPAKKSRFSSPSSSSSSVSSSKASPVKRPKQSANNKNVSSPGRPSRQSSNVKENASKSFAKRSNNFSKKSSPTKKVLASPSPKKASTRQILTSPANSSKSSTSASPAKQSPRKSAGKINTPLKNANKGSLLKRNFSSPVKKASPVKNASPVKKATTPVKKATPVKKNMRNVRRAPSRLTNGVASSHSKSDNSGRSSRKIKPTPKAAAAAAEAAEKQSKKSVQSSLNISRRSRNRRK